MPDTCILSARGACMLMRRRWRQVAGCTLAVLLLLAGCGSRRSAVAPVPAVPTATLPPVAYEATATPTPYPVLALASFPPLASYQAGLRPDQAAHLEHLSHLPRYEIEVELLPSLRTLWGHASVAVLNSSPDNWSRLVFRLPANLPRLEAVMQVSAVHVNGQAVTPAASDSATVLIIPLDTPLQPGHWIQVDLEWQLQYAHGNDDLASYILMGSNQDMISLPHFYPELAVYAPGNQGTTAGWWTVDIPEYADIRFHPATLMRVSVTAPRDLVVVANGVPIAEVPVADSRVRHTWITGPVRGFVLQASPLYVTSAIEVNGVTLRSYYHATDAATAQNALAQAGTALQAFERHFGPYPYPHLVIATAPLSDRGMEYSTLIQIGALRYRYHPDNTAWLIVHEVSHQWWYLQVHNDPVHAAAIDEGLAELAYLFWLEEVLGEYDRQNMVTYWHASVREFHAAYGGQDAWWQPDMYQGWTHYTHANYSRPAAFLAEAWAIAGDTAFREALRNFLADNRYRIVTFQELATALRTVTDDERMDRLLEAWQSQTHPLP